MIVGYCPPRHRRPPLPLFLFLSFFFFLFLYSRVSTMQLHSRADPTRIVLRV
eukprot:EC851851.1.p6 GENE.EC851851.1~~EC851851.1.p6  ORF type:complete len:52 (+),score=15.66 EC851851.1:148-303(+)